MTLDRGVWSGVIGFIPLDENKKKDSEYGKRMGKLREKLDRMTKGYPKTENGAELPFLKKIFTEEDAEFFINFKPGLQTVAAVAEHYGITCDEAEARLEDMSGKHLMYWERDGNSKKYRIVPYIHGLWEFNVDIFDATDAKNMGTLYVSGFAKSFMDYRLPMSRIVPIRAETVKDGKLLPGDDYAGAIMRRILSSPPTVPVERWQCLASGAAAAPIT